MNPFSEIEERLQRIEGLIVDLTHKPQTELDNQRTAQKLLTVQEAADFLSLSIQTIYGKISRGELPVMKRGKRCYFSRDELFEYVKSGRRKTALEMESEIETVLVDSKDLS